MNFFSATPISAVPNNIFLFSRITYYTKQYFSNITGLFIQAGIHRLRGTIHLIRIIDDTLSYLQPKCTINVPYLRGNKWLSSELFNFLHSKQYPRSKHNTKTAEGKVKTEATLQVIFC